MYQTIIELVVRNDVLTWMNAQQEFITVLLIIIATIWTRISFVVTIHGKESVMILILELIGVVTTTNTQNQLHVYVRLDTTSMITTAVVQSFVRKAMSTERTVTVAMTSMSVASVLTIVLKTNIALTSWRVLLKVGLLKMAGDVNRVH